MFVVFVNVCLIVLLFFSNTYAVDTIAHDFIYPVLGDSQTSSIANIIDPKQDGWYVDNGFGTKWQDRFTCCSPGGKDYPYHPGEDWNRTKGDANKSVYSIGNGVVTRVKNLTSVGMGWAVIIQYHLESEIDITPYILPGTTVLEINKRTSIVSSLYLHINKPSFSGFLEDAEYPNVSITKGDVIGIINSDLSHLHFELRANNSTRTADPLLNRAGYYSTLQDITDFGYINPSMFIENNVRTSSSAASFNFNTSIDGWYLNNAQDQGLDGTNWKFDPLIDPQLISPQLTAINANTYKILKIKMGITGSGLDTGKVYFKNSTTDSWNETKRVSFPVNKNSTATQQIYYVPMNTNAYWTGQIPQIRVDPTVNYPTDTTGSTYVDNFTFESLRIDNSFIDSL